MSTLSPFVVKVSYYLPSDENRAKNASNANYIATRPGADKGDIEPEREDLSNPELHLKYAAERPGSHGLFDGNGVAGLTAVKEELGSHEGIVWRMIVSLREDEAIRIQHNSREAFENSLKLSLPQVAEKMGVPDSQLKWAAAFHAEPGHPHCHLLVWEKDSKRTQGQLSKGEIRDIKKVFVRQIYSQERERLLIQKNFLRGNIKDFTKAAILKSRTDIDQESIQIRAEIGGNSKAAPRLQIGQQIELDKRLSILADHMPGQGRIALKYMPEDVKLESRAIVDWILSQPGFSRSTQQYLELHRHISMEYTHQPERLDEAVQKAYDDLRDRITQDVLKGAASYRNEQNQSLASRVIDSNNIEPIKQYPGHTNLAGSIWKGAWQSLQREKSKTEHQARVLQAQREYEEKEQKRREGRDR